MKLVLIHCTHSKEEWVQTLSSDYVKKISFFYPFEIQAAKPAKAARDDKEFKKKSESEAIQKLLKSDDFVVLFDEKGQQLSSIDFSQKINQGLISGKKRICFIIGGAYGVSDEIKQNANMKISLSKLTFNHLIAQSVALEQIYRGICILKNYPYHNI